MKLPKQLITANGCELNVTWVNPSTQQGSRMIHKYERTTKGDSIFTAYKRPSTNKVVAYRVKDKAGNIYIIYHTPDNRFAIQYKSL